MAMDQTLRPSETAGLVPTPSEPGSSEDFEVNLVSLNQWQIAWRRFRRHKLAVFGSLLFLTIVAIALIGPIFLPYDYLTLPAPQQHCAGDAKSLWANGCPPSVDHIFGTTGGLGRDVL